MQKARGRVSSHRLWTYGFRFYCTPLLRVLFTFPSQYWFTIGLSRVFSLAGWYRRFHTGLHWSRATQDTGHCEIRYVYGAVTLYCVIFQRLPLYITQLPPVLQPRHVNIPVWASPRSLATTCGITFVFFSSSYLDVSVQRVVHLTVSKSST